MAAASGRDFRRRFASVVIDGMEAAIRERPHGRRGPGCVPICLPGDAVRALGRAILAVDALAQVNRGGDLQYLDLSSKEP